MKNIWIWILGILGVFVVIYLWMKGSGGATATPGTQQSTGTQTTQDAWLAGWNGFTGSSLKNLGASARNSLSGLFARSNNFGVNDGGTNPGVSIAGSLLGGLQSSGSGAGVPSSTMSVQSAQSSPATQSTAAPLNGYDDSDYADYGDDFGDDFGDDDFS
jgi:hypothetical protein